MAQEYPSAVSHHLGLGLVPAEVGPYVGAALAADRAYEARLKVGKPNLVGPGIRTDRNGVLQR
jgi:hypothetical protein